MKNSNNFPPLGMCGGDRQFIHGKMTDCKVEYVKTGMVQTLTGGLDKYCVPSFDVIVGLEKRRIRAILDTGSYFSYIKQWINDEFLPTVVGFETGNNPQNGTVSTPVVELDFNIRGIEADFSTTFMIMHESFNYDMILGAHFLELCNLNISGEKRCFELSFFDPI